MLQNNIWLVFAFIVCIYLLRSAGHLTGPKEKLKRIWRNRAGWQREVEWERENTTILRSSINIVEKPVEKPVVETTSNNVILTSVYSYNKDPQRRKFIPCEFDYIANFYNSVFFHGLNAIIMHDCYSEQFVKQYETDKIAFVRVNSPDKSMSTNDFRFKPYNSYLKENRHDYYMFVDASDVFFNGNPFNYMKNNKHGHTLFMSPDKGTFHKNAWQVKKCYKEAGRLWDQNVKMHNAGVWGGDHQTSQCILKCVVNQFETTLKGINNCNMPTVNWCVHFGGCTDENTVEDQPDFVNPWTRNCRGNYLVIHNKCKDTQYITCLVHKDDKLVLQDRKGSRCKPLKNVVPVDDTSDSKVHICLAADKSHEVGISALIRSIKKNTKTPDNVIFHEFSLDSEYSLQDVQQYINSNFSATDRGNLKSPANYVRFILAKKLPQVDACWWIDADVIVQGDIVEYTKNIHLNKLVAAFPREPGEQTKINELDDKIYSTMTKEGLHLSSSKMSFNAGIVYINLYLWRKRNIDAKYSLWTHLGSQPLLQFLSGDNCQFLDRKDYADGLGWRKGLTVSPKTMFLHWNGPHKPWLPKGQYKDFWEPFSTKGDALNNQNKW